MIMKDNFKKGIVLIFALLFSALIFAQEDSTDLTFYGEPFIPLNQGDSITYHGDEYLSTTLEFDLLDEEISSIWIEVIGHAPDGNSGILFSQSYTLEELDTQNLINEDHVIIDFLPVSNYYECQVFVILKDSLGHEKISIAKHLVK